MFHSLIGLQIIQYSIIFRLFVKILRFHDCVPRNTDAADIFLSTYYFTMTQSCFFIYLTVSLIPIFMLFSIFALMYEFICLNLLSPFYNDLITELRDSLFSFDETSSKRKLCPIEWRCWSPGESCSCCPSRNARDWKVYLIITDEIEL